MTIDRERTSLTVAAVTESWTNRAIRPTRSISAASSGSGLSSSS